MKTNAKNELIVMRVDNEMREKLGAEADKLRMSISVFVRMICAEYLNKKQESK